MKLTLSALVLTALPFISWASDCVGTGCEMENRVRAMENRLQATEKLLAKAEASLTVIAQKKPEVSLQCQTVIKDSEVLIYEDRVVVESDLTKQGYRLVGGGCSFPDWKKFEMPALVAGHPKDNSWICSYKNARPARITGYATYCRAVLEN